MSDRVTGEPFKRVYVEASKNLPDSKRFRHRIRHRIYEDMSDHTRIKTIFATELGVSVPWRGAGYDVWSAFEDLNVADFLSVITYVYRLIHETRSRRPRSLGLLANPAILAET